MAQMTGQARIYAAMKHEEPDRVPISPRVFAWLKATYGDGGLETQLRELPDMDVMHIVSDGTPNYIDSYPDTYDLPGVDVVQEKRREGDFVVVSRVFKTPAGTLSDCTRIPPSGREYGVSPNPVKMEHMVKTPDDLQALVYVLPQVNTQFDFVHTTQKQIGDRGVVMVCVRSGLDHHAGYARSMQDLMVDYYDNRTFFDALIDLFHKRSLQQIKAALEGGVAFIFGSWYFTSLSVGWSPAIFKEAFWPRICDHVNLTHDYGAFYDFYDDGKLNATMHMIADAGVDVIETCTPPPIGDFDLALAKQTIGNRVTLKGYVDLLYVVERGTPALIDHTVREAMMIAKPGGGFIIGSSDSFREATPKANIAAYFDACKRYGIY